MLPHIEPVDQCDDEAHPEEHPPIGDEPVDLEGSVDQHQDDAQLEERLEDADPGKDPHPLIRHDEGIEGHLHDRHHKGEHGEVVDPERCRHTPRWDDQVAVDKPQPHRLRQKPDHESQCHMEVPGGAESDPQVRLIPSPQIDGEEALRRPDHRPIEEAEHRHHATNYVVETIVGHPEGGEERTGGIEPDQQHDQLPDVEHQRIAGDTTVAPSALLLRQGWFHTTKIPPFSCFRIPTLR